ncbi:MAG: 1-aminocyclopropane-1-carboxylate deaminase/D-cysteine desulfhydrase [Saprospiraceae bacterium]
MEKNRIDRIETDFIKANQVELWMKREDLVHPIIAGNKWRKLFYNLAAAKAEGKTHLISFGGAYSNHIHAVAAAGPLYQLKTIGIIRGERPAVLNPTLQFAEKQGMLLHFVSRSVYRNKTTALEQLDLPLATSYILPEGGTNNLAIKGCQAIITSLTKPFDYYCVSCGTGGTIAGMVTALDNDSARQVLGFSALKGDFLQKEVATLMTSFNGRKYENWKINFDYHFGGYAKHTTELIEFMNAFKHRQSITLDPIYTGKMMYGIFDLIGKGYFPKGANILAIHTGGLQGLAGFQARFGALLT